MFDLNVSQDLQTILLIVLFGIGTDYILFLLFRYRERLRAGDDKRTAMVTSVQRVGEVIASAAAAVIVAFLVLLLASLGFFGSLGPALAIAVGVMLITSLTLIPAVVSLLGRFVFWPSKAWQHQPNGNARRTGSAAPSAAGRRSSRPSPAACWSSSRRAASGTRPTTTSAPASRRTPSRPGPRPTCSAASRPGRSRRPRPT